MSKKHAVRWVALLCAVFLAAIPLARATDETDTWDLTESEMRAVEMIYQVYQSSDAKEQETLLLQAAQAAPDSPFILLESANLLSELNIVGALTDTIETILKKAKSIATGELRDQALRALGDHYLVTKGLEVARTFIDDEMTESPNDLTLQTMLAKLYYYSDEIDAALMLLDDIWENFPQALEAAELRALLLLDEKRWDDAIEAFSGIEEGFPDSPVSLSGRYLAFAATGQFEPAIRAINEEILFTGDESLWIERLNIRVYKQKDPVGALPEANALINAHPDWVDAYFAKINAQIMMEQYDSAIETAREVSKIDENLSRLLEGLALMAGSRWEEAKALILPAVLEPYLAGWWADASILFLQGYDDVDSATEALRQSFAAENNFYDSFLRLGDLNAHLGNLLEAARCYYRAEQHADDDALAMEMLVVTLIDAGRREEAAKYLQTMEARYPGWYETMIARVLYEQVFGTPADALVSFVALKEKFPFPATTILPPLEASLLLAAGDAKGEWLIDEWMNQKDSESLTIDDWLQYAETLQYSENKAKMNDALDRAETYLEKIDPARVNVIRWAKARLLSCRAEAAKIEGDMESYIGWLEKACELGATLLFDTLETADGTPWPSEAYDALYRLYGPDPEPWDITVFPVIPK